VLFASTSLTLAMLVAGVLAGTSLVIEAAKRRRWGLILGGYLGLIVLFRAVDYAFGPRRPSHPHPRFVPGRLGLGRDDMGT
jgi:hypothetical protein